jgi:hypothetical protein
VCVYVCLCVCMCMYVCMYVCMHVRMYGSFCLSFYLFSCSDWNIHTHTYMHTFEKKSLTHTNTAHTYIHTYIPYICNDSISSEENTDHHAVTATHTQTCIHTHIVVPSQPYIHTYAHIHTYIITEAQNKAPSFIPTVLFIVHRHGFPSGYV